MNDSQRTCLYIDPDKHEDNSVAMGVNWLRTEAAKSASVPQGLVAYPAKGHMKDNLTGLIDPTLLNDLASRGRGQVAPGVTVSLMTERKKPRHAQVPVLAIHPTPELLDAVDDLHGVPEVLVVPQSMDGDRMADWIRRSGAHELGSAMPKASSPDGLPRAVVRALTDLTGRVNVSGGFVGSYDKADAVEAFEFLRDHGVIIEPARITDYLIGSLGWGSKAAHRAEQLAEGVLAGRRFHRDKGRWNPDVMLSWLEEEPTRPSD
jgi:hypothetical protein